MKGEVGGGVLLNIGGCVRVRQRSGCRNQPLRPREKKTQNARGSEVHPTCRTD